MMCKMTSIENSDLLLRNVFDFGEFCTQGIGCAIVKFIARQKKF